MVDTVADTAEGVSIAAQDGPFGAALIPSSCAGDLSLNLHRTDHPSGEIRGQIQYVVPLPVGIPFFVTELAAVGAPGRARPS